MYLIHKLILINKEEITKTILIESHFAPSLEYFVSLLNKKKILIEAYENYQKQSYRNRCYILTSQNIDKLIVPIINPHKKIIIKDLKIDNNSKWFKNIRKSIYTAYGKAPFFIYYEEKLNKILFKNHKFLLDLNLDLIYLFLEFLGIESNITLTNKYYDLTKQNNFPILDLRNIIHFYKGINTFKNRSIYKEFRYIQTFGKEFIPNLSIIDLIMCEGPNSLSVLEKSSINKLL